MKKESSKMSDDEMKEAVDNGVTAAKVLRFLHDADIGGNPNRYINILSIAITAIIKVHNACEYETGYHVMTTIIQGAQITDNMSGGLDPIGDVKGHG